MVGARDVTDHLTVRFYSQKHSRVEVLLEIAKKLRAWVEKRNGKGPHGRETTRCDDRASFHCLRRSVLPFGVQTLHVAPSFYIDAHCLSRSNK